MARAHDGRAGLLTDVALARGGAVTGLRVELRPAARLALRRTGGPQVVRFQVRSGNALLATGALDADVSSDWFVPPGPLTVSLSYADSSVARAVDAPAGVTSEVLFELH